MTAQIFYPWPALTGVWVVLTVIFIVWWLVSQHRMEQIEHEMISDLAGRGDHLSQLLSEEVPMKT